MNDTIEAGDALDGLLPDDATGVYFRDARLLLCRDHLNIDTIGALSCTGVVRYGFVDCDECRRVWHGAAAVEKAIVVDDAPACPVWLNVDAVIAPEARGGIRRLLDAADQMLVHVAEFMELVPGLRDIERVIDKNLVAGPDVVEVVERAIGLNLVRARVHAAGFLLGSIEADVVAEAVRLDQLTPSATCETVAKVVAWMLDNGAREYLVSAPAAPEVGPSYS